ncbi:MAG: iron ABC transporter permease [Deltaproteobacteria bacterium]|nr:iron ABC transporter permease [Deltaproteobacteria bacterium]
MDVAVSRHRPLLRRIFTITLLLGLLLALSALAGLSVGSSGFTVSQVFEILLGGGEVEPTMADIVWRIRLPRVVLAALVGAVLSLGGLVFQALLRNPLAEPYILGISGGAAVGAIIGILMGLARFPGVSLLAFAGSMATVLLVLVISSVGTAMRKDSLILAGVMVNAFCSSVIMFLVSLTQDSRIHNILFWLMGDLSMADAGQIRMLALTLLPCFALILVLSRPMNLLLMGEEMAENMGVNVKVVSVALLVITSFMVSTAVCHSGILGFVGLVMPHLLRLGFGPDHRLLVPASLLGGGAYLIICDLLARSLPAQGEMPVGVITAMIGAPLFIVLLQRSRQ